MPVAPSCQSSLLKPKLDSGLKYGENAWSEDEGEEQEPTQPDPMEAAEAPELNQREGYATETVQEVISRVARIEARLEVGVPDGARQRERAL